MNTIHFLIDMTSPQGQNHGIMPNRNDDMAVLIDEICGEVAGPWRKKIAASVSAAGAPHEQGGADRFRNVRGFIINDTIELVLAGIAGNCGRDIMKAAMDTYMKIQALEAPSAGAAVDFLQQLKSLVSEIALRCGDSPRAEAARAVEKTIEEWIVVAVEIYQEKLTLIPRLWFEEKRRTEIRTLKKDKDPEVHQ
jgi:hypothetical protein